MPRVPTTSMELVSLRLDHDGNAAVHFRPSRPLRFTAGQHGLWVVPGGGIGSMAIASAPGEDLVTVGSGLSWRSRFERSLRSLEVGSRVWFLGPLGRFTVTGSAPSVIMLCHGMGVSPFRSMLRHAARTGSGPRTTLVHCGTEHPFRADTEAVAEEAHYPRSREEFRRQAAAAARQPNATFMVSGPAEFVRSTTALLRGNSVAASRIKRNPCPAPSPGTRPQRPAQVAIPG